MADAGSPGDVISFSPERSKGKENQVADNIHGSATSGTAISQTLL